MGGNRQLHPGAGEGNRTLVISLEGFCSTIELHPPTPATPGRRASARQRGLPSPYRIPPLNIPSPAHEPERGANTMALHTAPLGRGRTPEVCLVEEVGFEPT